MMSHLSCRVGMGGIRELLDGKIWEWDLSFTWEWEWDGNGNKSLKWEGIGTKNLFPHTSTPEPFSIRICSYCAACHVIAISVTHLSLNPSLFPSPSMSFPFLLLPFTFPLSTPYVPLEVGPLNTALRVCGSAVSSPSGVWDGAPAEIEFGAF